MKASILISTVVILCSTCLFAGTWTTFDYPEARSTSIYAIDGSNIIGQVNGNIGFIYNFSTRNGTILAPPWPYTLPYGSGPNGIDGINIVGQYQWGYNNQGFLYDSIAQTWTTLNLNLQVGIDEVYGGGISGKYVVGYLRQGGLVTDGDGAGYYHGFIYDLTKQTCLKFDHPYGAGGSGNTRLWAIDGSKIVGNFDDGLGYGCFMYDLTTGTWTNLPTSFQPFGISGDNIVGCVENKGFLYNISTQKWNLLDIPGTLTRAWGIDGNNVVGEYYDDAGQHGFIYTIPEPCTLAFLGLGGLLLSRRKK